MEFNKNNLLPGMIVVFRCGIKTVYTGINQEQYMRFVFIDNSDTKLIECYNISDKLQNACSNHYDIMRIESYDGTVIWERYECPFKHGEIVEVSDDEDIWFIRRFNEYKPSSHPFRVYDDGEYNQECPDFTPMKYCRKPE